MPQATKLPSGKWRAQVYLGKDENGKRLYKSFTAGKKAEAESLAYLWSTSAKARKNEEEAERAREKLPTLGEACDWYIDTCRAQGYSPSTIPTYIKIRKTSFPDIIDAKICDITAADIQNAINKRSAKCSPKTVKNDFGFIRSVLRRYRPELALSGIILAKKRKKKKRVFKASWAEDILRYIRANCRTDFYIYATFIVSVGLRPSETYSLTWGDLSPAPIDVIGAGGDTYQVGNILIDSACVMGEDGNYYEKDPKTDAGLRTQQIDWAFFEDLYSVRPRGSAGSRLTEMKPNKCSKYWADVKKALDLPDDMRFYDLRHFYATSVKSSGATEQELAAAMGHSTPVFSNDVYVEIFEEDQRAVNRAMAKRTNQLYENIADGDANRVAKTSDYNQN